MKTHSFLQSHVHLFKLVFELNFTVTIISDGCRNFSIAVNVTSLFSTDICYMNVFDDKQLQNSTPQSLLVVEILS